MPVISAIQGCDSGNDDCHSLSCGSLHWVYTSPQYTSLQCIVTAQGSEQLRVIVDLENDVLGLADYKACKASTTPENMYPRHIVTAVVSGYDEENQWVLLEAPEVQREEVKLPPNRNFQ